MSNTCQRIHKITLDKMAYTSCVSTSEIVGYTQQNRLITYAKQVLYLSFFICVWSVEKQWSTTIDIYHYRSLCQTFNDHTHTQKFYLELNFFVKIHLSSRMVWIFGEGGERILLVNWQILSITFFSAPKPTAKKKK